MLWWPPGHGDGDVDHHVYLAELLVLFDRLDQGRHARVGVAMHFAAELVLVVHGNADSGLTPSAARVRGSAPGMDRGVLMDMRPNRPKSSASVLDAGVPVPFEVDLGS